MSLTSIAEIKEGAKMLDTAAAQWLNAGPPDQIQSRLNEAREMLQRGLELADAPLRIALVGEFNSGKTLLLNSLLDSTDFFPCLLQPCTGNVLEVRVNLRSEERPPEIRQATISFFNKYEIENILEHYIKDLKTHNIDGLPTGVTLADLEKLERLLCKKFQDMRQITPKYAILSALEFIMALRYNRELVLREDRHSCTLPMDLIAKSLTLTGRADLNKGIQAIHTKYKQTYSQNKDRGLIDKITSKNLRSVFPMVRRVMVEVSAWCVPFGIKNPKECSSLAFLDFPGLGAEGSSARDQYLCMTEINDAHSVLIVFNGSNPGASGASVMATLFQRAGKLTSDRTIVAVNRFDEFHPLPSEQSIDEYYSRQQEGTTVGFYNILVPARNVLSSASKKFSMYICSALCYLFDEKAQRPNWNFGNANWFNDSKRQAAYTLYKRCSSDFNRLINEASKSGVSDHQLMKEGLARYLDQGGIPSLRQDLVRFAMQKGERLILEDSLKEVRSALRTLDDIAPAMIEGEKGNINPEVSYAAQEFYRVLELAVADTLPTGPSEYKRLKNRGTDKDISLWEIIDEEISANVSSWPEWFAILNQGMNKGPAEKPGKPQKRFSRYQKIKKPGGTVPTEFNAFNERFRNTAQNLTQQTLEHISKAVFYSVKRFEEHPDYRDAIEHFQGMILADKLPSLEEALPLLDVWSPSQLAEEEIVPTILERIEDEVKAIEELSYPYDGSKPCFWNLALIIRVQVQLVKTYRDKLSRLVAAAESQFQGFFCNEVLRAEILPLVRTALNDPDFLGEVALSDGGSSWEGVGQVVRSAVNRFKEMDSSTAGIYPPKQASGAAPQPAAESASETVSEPTDEVDDFEDDFDENVADEPPVEEESADEKLEEAPPEIVDDEDFEEW